MRVYIARVGRAGTRDGNENEMVGCVGRGTERMTHGCCLSTLSEFEAQAARCTAHCTVCVVNKLIRRARPRRGQQLPTRMFERETRPPRRRGAHVDDARGGGVTGAPPLRHQLNAAWAPRVDQRTPDTSHCGAATRKVKAKVEGRVRVRRSHNPRVLEGPELHVIPRKQHEERVKYSRRGPASVSSRTLAMRSSQQ